ncbi:hypothetical protein [Streptacidiphilus carbonis]|uniref:hypothetical protein n=1 Tax=Streptacidiphilus carbonis TaxID=105422 RepID=UPI0005A96EDE|nr:hypothetical protein [Streptacidiphilus carbonis]
MAEDIWGFDPAHYTVGTDLTGYQVEATDGSIGKVDEATYDVGSACVVVNCKPWLIGKHVLLPAGLITGIDQEHETIHVGRSKDQIKGAPEYRRTEDVMGGPDTAYRDVLATYYGRRPL